MSTAPVPNKQKGAVGKGWVTPPDTARRSHRVPADRASGLKGLRCGRSGAGDKVMNPPGLSTLRPRCRSPKHNRRGGRQGLQLRTTPPSEDTTSPATRAAAVALGPGASKTVRWFVTFGICYVGICHRAKPPVLLRLRALWIGVCGPWRS